MADVLARRRHAFLRIGFQQPGRRLAAQHQIELPHQIVGILHAGIAAARAERRHDMRRIAGEQHAAVVEAFHAAAGEAVDADPFVVELALAQHGFQPRRDAVELLLRLGIGIGAELEIDAEHLVGLAMQQHRLAAMEGRIEPEPALGRKLRLHAHVGDQEAVVEHLAVEAQAHHGADRAAHAIGGDDVLRGQPVDAIRRLDLQPHLLAILLDADDLVLPAQIDFGKIGAALDQVLLDIILLQVDEGRETLMRLALHLELVDQPLADIELAGVPQHALVQHALRHAQPVPDFQRALRPADGAAADRDGVVFVQHDDLDGRAAPDRAPPSARPGRRRRSTTG